MEVRGIAKKSAYNVIKLGNTSPFTIDLGFLMLFILAATSWTARWYSGLEKVEGICDGTPC